jgi:mono/diheme cytochrome c family protein
MRDMSLIALWVYATVIDLGSSTAMAQTAPGPFADAEVQAGHSVYTSYCASCHGADLNGTGNFPALTGKAFMSEWRGRTTHDLYEKIRGTMPYCAGGTLDDNSYVVIVAWILKANGAATGGPPLATDTSVTISRLIK